MKGWAKEHEWHARALAFDRFMTAAEVEAEAATRVRKVEERADRRAQVDEDSWDLAQRARRRALEILAWPLAEERVAGPDGKTTIIAPAGWRPADAIALARLADELARTSVGLPTRISAAHQVVSGPAETKAGQPETPARLVAAWRDLAAADALKALGIDDAQPDDDEDD
jgi:hypothetical protein